MKRGVFILEKTLSVEEKLKRAEEIYERRRSLQGNRVSSNTINIGNKPDWSLLKKTLIKLLFCVFLYFLLYFVKNSNYFFSRDATNKINEILSYDINLQEIYNQTSKYLENLSKSFQNLNYIESNEGNNDNENKNIEENKMEIDKTNSNNETNVESVEKNKLENIVDTKENNFENEINNIEDSNNKEYSGAGDGDETVDNSENEISEEEKDIKYIKDNFNLEMPVKGVITSKFGNRTPSSIVSVNHSGIDIGVLEGTKIKAAAQGIVTLVSNFGDYRKSLGNKK